MKHIKVLLIVPDNLFAGDFVIQQLFQKIVISFHIQSDRSENSLIRPGIAELSELIDQARETNDQVQRTALYKEAMGYVLDLAVELPVYQRDVLYAYNANVLNTDTMPDRNELNPYSSPLERIWEIEFAA
jgi:ABC-type transport system substrate-binding protein